MSKLKAIKGLLIQNKKQCNSIFDEPHVIKASLAYNRALEHVTQFIDNYENDTISKEFIDSLIKISEEK